MVFANKRLTVQVPLTERKSDDKLKLGVLHCCAIKNVGDENRIISKAVFALLCPRNVAVERRRIGSGGLGMCIVRQPLFVFRLRLRTLWSILQVGNS